MPELVRVGRVGRPHGLAGAFVVEAASENESLFDPGATLLAGGVAATVVERKRAGGRLVLRLEPRPERGAALEVPREALPAPEEGSYYVADLVGLEVVEEGGRTLGRVRDVSGGVANDVLELDSGVLLPMHEECILAVEIEAGRVLVARGFAEHE